MGHSLRPTVEQCLPYVDRELRRHHVLIAAIGAEPEDVRQEALIATMRCVKRYRKDRGLLSAYVRASVRNTVRSMSEHAIAGCHRPKNAWGRTWSLPYGFAAVDDVAIQSNATPIDEAVAAKQLIRKLQPYLAADEWRLLVGVFVEGAERARAIVEGRASAQQRVQFHLVRSYARSVLEMIIAGDPTIARQLHPVGTSQKEDAVGNVVLPETPKEELSDCHPDGKKPGGYDPADPKMCPICPDKFTCLPLSIKRKLVPKSTVDGEVAAVLSGEMLYDVAIQRMKKRDELLTKGKPIPDDLLPTCVKAKPEAAPAKAIEDTKAEEPEVEEEESEEDEAEEEEESDDSEEEATEEEATEEEAEPEEEKMAAKKKAAKKAKKAKAPKAKTPKGKAKKGKGEEPSVQAEAVKSAKKAGGKKPAKPKPPSKEKKEKSAKKASDAKAKKDAKPKTTKYADGVLVICGRQVPGPRELTEEEMEKSIARVKIAQPFDLEYGMQIVRKLRGGDEVSVKITKKGWEYKGKLYSSLSTCVWWAKRRLASCNEFFNLETQGGAEIRDAKGKVLASHDSVTSE